MSFRVLCITVIAVLGIMSCSTDPDTTEPGTRTPAELVTELTDSYIEMDIRQYLDCLTDDFAFVVHKREAGGYIPDSVWYMRTEMNIAEAMFSQCDSINLEMTAISIEPWAQDTSMVQIDCTFSLQVYRFQGTAYRAQGESMLIAREVSEGWWSVMEWYDFSETKEQTTWSRIKYYFLTGLFS